jgi:hypothetical protein
MNDGNALWWGLFAAVLMISIFVALAEGIASVFAKEHISKDSTAAEKEAATNAARLTTYLLLGLPLLLVSFIISALVTLSLVRGAPDLLVSVIQEFTGPLSGR